MTNTKSPSISLANIFGAASLVSIIATDNKGIITFFNTGAERLLGYSAKELVGISTPAIFHLPREIEEKNKKYSAITCKQIVGFDVFVSQSFWIGNQKQEWTYVTKEGKHLQVLLAVTPISQDDGSSVGYLGIAIDITERKALEKAHQDQQRLMQMAIDNIPQFIFWKNTNSIYQGCNKNFAVAAGVGDPAKIVGKTDYDLAWKKEEAEFFRACDRRVINSQVPEYHIIEPQLHADGKQAWIDTNKVPMLDGENNLIGLLGTFEDITDRLRVQEELRQSEQNFRAFFEMASVGVAQVDIRSGKYKKINQKYCDIVGFDMQELHNSTSEMITHPDDLDCQEHQLKLLLDGRIPEFTIEKRYIQKNGAIVWAYLTVSPLWREDENPDCVLVVIRDITARKQAEERLVFAQKVFDNSIEGIIVTDTDATILQVNATFSVITGYSAVEVIGQNPRILKSDKHSLTFYEEMWRTITAEGQWAGEVWNRRKNGEAYPEWLTISAVKNDKGITTNYVAIFHDISQHVQQQEVIQFQAQHDALTGLPNRVLLNDRLVNALEKNQISGMQIALLYLDIDNFKYINDAFGHTVGDDILVEFSTRFSSLMRIGDTIARLGGDDFLILLTDLEDLNVVSNIAIRLLGSLKKPFHHGDIEFYITASVGITIAPDDGLAPVTLVKNSEIAMYRAKKLGKNNYQYFAPEFDIQAHRRIALEMKLRKAIEHEEFELYYQPLVNNVSGKIVSAEALIRWKSEGKLLSPAEFIPLAEDSGLILPMGEWVLKSAARQAKIWQDAGYALTVSVNISSRQFTGQDLFTLFQNVLNHTGLEYGRLYLEVTESMVMSDLANAQRIMGALREFGAKFYLDDFGTGYSSLAYLKKLPLDGLKIDRSFIKDIVEDSDSEAIAAVIISLANTLNLQIVAEGVETIEQWKMLHGMSEMLIQGYLVSKPVPADEFELLFKKGDILWQEY